MLFITNKKKKSKSYILHQLAIGLMIWKVEVTFETNKDNKFD